jgi:DNA topoisomerase-2
MAGCTKYKVNVHYNGVKIPIRKFLDYIDMYLPTTPEGKKPVKLYESSGGNRWEYAVSISDGQF